MAFVQINVHQICLIFASITTIIIEKAVLSFLFSRSTYFQLDEIFVFVVVALLHFVFVLVLNRCCSLFFPIGANILIDSTGEKVKLADFNTSIKLDNGYQQDNYPRGTGLFMAPEVYSTCNYQ